MSTPVDWPIGTPGEREAARGELPGHWQVTNPFLNPYQIGGQGPIHLHTGVDLNLNTPDWNADWHKPIYAPVSGTIIFAGPGLGSWGTIIVGDGIDPLSGEPFCWRAGHVEHPIVQPGDTVVVGQPIAQVGDGDGYYAPGGAHLHFDISPSDLLRAKPNHWPGVNRQLLLLNYVDPVDFIFRRYAVSANINFASYFRQLLSSKPRDTEVTMCFGIPPLREPISTHECIKLTIGDILGELPELPDPGLPVGVETWYVDSAVGAQVRTSPGGPVLLVAGRRVVIADNAPVRISKFSRPAMLNGTLYNWHELYTPDGTTVLGWIAEEVLTKNP